MTFLFIVSVAVTISSLFVDNLPSTQICGFVSIIILLVRSSAKQMSEIGKS